MKTALKLNFFLINVLESISVKRYVSVIGLNFVPYLKTYNTYMLPFT